MRKTRNSLGALLPWFEILRCLVGYSCRQQLEYELREYHIFLPSSLGMKSIASKCCLDRTVPLSMERCTCSRISHNYNMYIFPNHFSTTSRYICISPFPIPRGHILNKICVGHLQNIYKKYNCNCIKQREDFPVKKETHMIKLYWFKLKYGLK